MSEWSKEDTGTDGFKSECDRVMDGWDRRLSVYLCVPYRRCDCLLADCTHKFVAGIHGEYIKHTATVRWRGSTLTTFVFARFENFPFRHDFLPVLLRLSLPGDFLELKRRKMGVALVLDDHDSP
jgi:hypothetical protein